MTNSQIPTSLHRALRTRYTSWTKRIPPWKRTEQPVPPKTLDTLAWLQFIAHVRRETEQHGWWYHAMAPVRLAKGIWGVILTYKKTSITIGLLGCSGWVLIGTSLNNSTDVQTSERFLTLNKIVTPATIYPSLSEQCPYSFINPITWCTYRVGNEYLEWSTPILDKVQEIETLRTDVQTLKNAPTSSNLDTLTALLEQHRTVKEQFDGLQSHFATHNIELTDLIPLYPINKLESLEQINIEHHKNQEALAALIEQAQQFNIEVEIEGPITNQALEEMQKLGTFLSTFDQWIERSNNVERPLVHNNPFTYTFTPILNTPLETQIESTNWNDIWMPQFKEIIQLEECQFIRENTPLKDQWTEDVQRHCMQAGKDSSSKFDAIYNGNTNQQRGFLSTLDTAKFDEVSDIFGYATATQWLANPNSGRNKVWNVLTDTYGIENLDRKVVVAHWLERNNTKRAWTTIGNITDTEDKHASLLLWMEYHTIRQQWSSVWKGLNKTSQSEINFESVISIFNKHKAPKSQWLKLISYSDKLHLLGQASVLVQIGTSLNTLGYSSLGLSLHHKALALSDGQNDVSTLPHLISIVGSSKQQNTFPNGTRLLDSELEVLGIRAIDVAKSIDHYSRRSEALKNIATALANSGLYELAINTANSIDYDDNKVEALSNIVTVLVNSGLYELAINTTNSIDYDIKKADVLGNIATIQANVGLFEQAINTAKSIDYDSEKFETLKKIVQSFSNTEVTSTQLQTLFELAINTANSIDSDSNKAEALKDITTAFSNTKFTSTQLQTLFELVINPAKSISVGNYKANALKDIATVQANAGLINEAVKTFELAINTANSISDDYGQANALKDIATAFSNTEVTSTQLQTLFELVINTAKSIDSDSEKFETLENIATVQANAGLINEAVKTFELAINTANSISYNDDKAEALNNIATAFSNTEVTSTQLQTLFELAINTANSISVDDYKADVLGNISTVQANAGLINEAVKTFEQAINTANSIDSDSKKANALKDLTTAFSNTEVTSTQLQTLFELAINTANSIDSDSNKAEALKNIATVQANAGLINEAVKTFEQVINTAKSIDDDYDQANALKDIATALANSGLFELAINTANSIDSDRYKAEALSNIATVQATMGLFEQAINTANSIDDDRYKAEALNNIATAQANMGLYELAINTANSISNYGYKADALKNIIQSLSNTELTSTQLQTLFELAINTTNSIDDDSYNAEALSNIATTQANSGLFEQAINTANSIDSDRYKADALNNIATAQANMGLFELAINTANSIDYDSYKADALSNIVTVLVNSGLYELAINTTNSIDSDSKKADALKNIATVQANVGLFEQAINTAKSIDYDSEKFETLKKIVQSFSNTEVTSTQLQTLFELAINTANSIDSDSNKAEALKDLTTAFSNTELTSTQLQTLFELAINTANSIDYDGYKADALSNIATTQANAGLYELAINTANSIIYDSSKAEALKNIATAQANNDLINEAMKTFERAINTANSIRKDRYKAKALSKIATAQANIRIFEKTVNTSNSIHDAKTAATSEHPIYSLLQPTSVANTHYSTNHMPVTDDVASLTNPLTIDSTFHTPLAWTLNPPKAQSTLPKEIVTLSKQLNLRTPPECIRDGINLGYTEGFIAYWTDALQRQVRAEGLRDQYRKSKGDPFESIEKWYGVIESPDRSTDPCIQPFPFPLLTSEQLDALDDELNKVARDASKFKDLVQQANSLSIDTSDWGAPFQFETWEAEIEMVSGLNTRMTDLIKRGQRMGLGLKSSDFNGTSILSKPYTTEQTDYLQREIERIEGIIDDWNTAKRTAASVGYRFPSKPILSDITQENLDWHNLYIPQTTAVRTIMRRLSFKSIPTGSITPIGETEAIKITKGFSISTTEIPQELYCAVLGPTKSCDFQSGYPYTGNWEDTTEFIQALSHQMGLEGCESPIGCNTGYRVPTLDEWRYAALAKQRTFYAGSNIADEVAWFGMTRYSQFPVQLKHPNDWGLYDMSGNVDEWVYTNKCAGGSADSTHEDTSIMSTSEVNSTETCGLRLVYSR